jgi:hypothetical protein
MPLPTKRTKKSTNPWDSAVYLYGPPKIGKSALCAHIPDALFVATEPGHKHLEIFRRGVADWQDFKRACAEVKGGKHDYKVIVVDTIDNALHMCMDNVCAEMKIKAPGDASNGTGWTRVANEFRTELLGLAAAPYGVVFVGHGNDRVVKMKTGGEYDKSDVALTGKSRPMALGLVDVVLYFGLKVVLKAGKPVTERVLYTNANPSHVAGNRIGLPPEISMNGTDEENYHAFMNAFKQAVSNKE